MTIAYFSATLPTNVDDVWAIVRDFGNYRLFTADRGEVFIEDGKRGDCVGAIRNATLDGQTVRQRLLTHSDVERRYQYEFCGTPPFPFENYVACLQFRPIVENRHTFVEWSATFDCDLEQAEPLRRKLEGLFATWFQSLKQSTQKA